MRAHKRIDIVVDSVAGEDPLLKQHGFLWQADLRNADAMFRQGLTSRIITAKHAALAMMPAKRGLIVEVTENDIIGGGANPIAHAVKTAQKVLPLQWASRARPAWHHRPRHHARFSPLGNHAAALRRDRRHLA